MLVSKKESPKSKRKVYELSEASRKEFEYVFPRHIERVEALMLALDKTILEDFRKIRMRTAELAEE